MRVNVYAEEMTDRIEIIAKEIEGQRFTGLRLYLELPTSLPKGVYLAGPTPSVNAAYAEPPTEETRNVRGPFMHRPGDDDSAAVTFWGKRDLRDVLRLMLAKLDEHYEERERRQLEALLARLTEAEEILDEIDDAGYGGDGTDQAERVRRFVHFPPRHPATPTPTGHAVGALLAHLEEAKVGSFGGKTYDRGRRAGIDAAARLIAATLGAPTPLDRAVGEVCAVDVSGIVDAEPGTYFMTIADLANGEGQMSDRDRNMMIAAIAIRSVLACDAPATKEPAFVIAPGVRFIRRGAPDDEYNGVSFAVEGVSASCDDTWALVPVVGPMIRLWASEAALRGKGWEYQCGAERAAKGGA